MITDAYNQPLKIGDKVCWSPYRRSIMFGKVIDISGYYPKVHQWYRGKIDTEYVRVIKSYTVYRIKEFPKFKH